MDLRHNIEDHHVIVVEDILDSGRTLHYLMGLLRGRGPRSVECCVLVRKPTMVKVDVPARYVGFDMDPPQWVVGYGLDYNEHFRTCGLASGRGTGIHSHLRFPGCRMWAF